MVRKRLLGRVGSIKIWLVDGDLVRRRYYKRFTEGGNDAAYSWMPRGEVWIDDKLPVKDRYHVIMHELYERGLMSKSSSRWPYHRAHEKANKMEWALRNPVSDSDFLEVNEIEVVQEANRTWSAYQFGILILRGAPSRKALIIRLRGMLSRNPVQVQWDNLHPLSREEIAVAAGFRTSLASAKWSELDEWVKSTLRDSLSRRSKRKVTLKNPARTKGKKKTSWLGIAVTALGGYVIWELSKR